MVGKRKQAKAAHGKRKSDVLVSTQTAAEILGLTVSQFTRIADKLGWAQDDEYKNPHYKSGPPGKLWLAKKIHARKRLKVVAEAREKKGGSLPRDYTAEFAKCYGSPCAALPDACEALFNLNRYTRHATCAPEHRAIILDLKSALIGHLYRAEEFTDRVEKLTRTLPAQECNRCEGAGCERCDNSGQWRAEREVASYVFTFTVNKQRYTWIQPGFALDFEPTVEATRNDDGKRGDVDKTLNIPRSKLAHAKALVRYALSTDKIALAAVDAATASRAFDREEARGW